MKYFIDFNLEDSGDVEQRLVEKKAQYDKLVAMSKEKLSAKSRKIAMSNEDGNVQDVLPIGEGSLIIDEVKVSAIWHSCPSVLNIIYLYEFTCIRMCYASSTDFYIIC